MQKDDRLARSIVPKRTFGNQNGFAQQRDRNAIISGNASRNPPSVFREKFLYRKTIGESKNSRSFGASERPLSKRIGLLK